MAGRIKTKLKRAEDEKVISNFATEKRNKTKRENKK